MVLSVPQVTPKHVTWEAQEVGKRLVGPVLGKSFEGLVYRLSHYSCTIFVNLLYLDTDLVLTQGNKFYCTRYS
jgi:hypothetical protein